MTDMSAVTAIPDEQKGERLVALYTCKDIAPEELWRRKGQECEYETA